MSESRRMVGRLSILMAGVFGAAGLVGISPANAGAGTLAPTDDAYTSQSNAAATHGGMTSLTVNSGSTAQRRVYLKFSVGSVPAGATGVSATLRLWAKASVPTSVILTVSRSATAWTEGSLTWNNQPAKGTTITTRAGAAGGSYNSFNLSPLVTANGTYAVVVTDNTTLQNQFNSKEATSKPPQLALSWTDPPSTGNPMLVTTGAATNVAMAGSTLNGTVTPNGQTSICHFDNGTSSSYTTATANDSSGGSGTTPVALSATLSGLAASTTYHYRLSCSGSAGLINGSDQSFTTSASTSAALSVSVSGGRLVDGNGSVVQLRGVNRSGTQYACAEGWGFFDGPSDDASLDAMKSWHVNAVRVNGNEDCWLGINGVSSAYAGANYQNKIIDYVNRIVARGMIAIVDLHHSAPGTLLATDQQPMADRDHAPAYWQGVANAFKNNPAVIFDLYNEPYPDSNRNTTAAWTCVRDGGTCPGVPFTAAGMQELLNAVRGTGASNVVMVGGPQYAGTLDKWLEYKPNDPLNQLAASIHIYFDKPATPDWSPCYLQSCWDSVMAPLAASTPIIIGEFGEHDCDFGLINGTSLNPVQQSLLTWADGHHVSYLAWAWFTGNCAGEPAVISDYAGTPTPLGAGVRSHYLLF